MLNCPTKNDNFNGNCEYCVEKTDCMLRDVMQKLQELNKTVAQIKSAAVKQKSSIVNSIPAHCKDQGTLVLAVCRFFLWLIR